MASMSRVGGGRDLRGPGLLAWLRLMRVFQKVDRALGDQLGAWGLSVGQFDVLARVGAAEGIVQQELADSLLVTKGNVCQLLDRMEGRGLILRRRESRNKRVFLTQEGRRLFDEVIPTHEALIVGWFSALSRAEQEQLHELLRKLDRALDGGGV